MFVEVLLKRQLSYRKGGPAPEFVKIDEDF